MPFYSNFPWYFCECRRTLKLALCEYASYVYLIARLPAERSSHTDRSNTTLIRGNKQFDFLIHFLSHNIYLDVMNAYYYDDVGTNEKYVDSWVSVCGSTLWAFILTAKHKNVWNRHTKKRMSFERKLYGYRVSAMEHKKSKCFVRTNYRPNKMTYTKWRLLWSLSHFIFLLIYMIAPPPLLLSNQGYCSSSKKKQQQGTPSASLWPSITHRT